MKIMETDLKVALQILGRKFYLNAKNLPYTPKADN